MKCFLYPDIGRVDEPLQLHMDGLEANETIKMKMTMDHHTLGKWSSTVSTNADEHGKLSIGENCKQDNNIFSLLLWKLRPIDGKTPTNFPSNSTDPLKLHIDMESSISQRTESRTVIRLFKEDYVTEEALPNDVPFSGTYFYPKNKQKLPTIILFGSYHGEPPLDAAALYASHGYGALAVNYTNNGATVPLEDINKVLQWVKNHPSTDEQKIILHGTEKGAELALVVASKDPSIKGVIANSPTSHVFQKIQSSKRTAAWTENGETIPFVPYHFSLPMMVTSWFRKQRKDTASLGNVCEKSLEKYEKNGKIEAAIEVEKVNGPLLLISGKQDDFWPSDLMAQTVTERLSNNSFPYPVEHLSYEFCGDKLTVPYLPTLTNNEGDFENVQKAVLGETAWNTTITFLTKHFPPARIQTVTIPFKPSGR
ncbi:acyl-CoA thioester hydrolase/BAAT C-terminal domain-containing protein [Evansella sp. AB-rgal1]|uniref:acyl-CoA thioester hydrolase/BAAT C-terminal domain-containing protein n=1 Tax=Evansella sp. AB-rgal1 TaxID=3242696 RepID=UPI00359CCE5C